MPYYTVGDYYGRGDYYTGDPGIFDVFRKVVGTVTGVAGKIIPGPVGAVARTVSKVVTPRPVSVPQIAPPAITATALVPTGGKQGIDVPADFPGAVREPGAMGAIQRFLPFGQSGYGAAPPGYHVNKAYLKFLRNQAMGKATQNPFNEPRARNLVVRNRKLNPLNPRALVRSARRQRGLVRVLSGALAGTGYKLTRKGVGGTKRKRRR